MIRTTSPKKRTSWNKGTALVISCQHCGIDFTSNDGHRRKYCSRECYVQVQKTNSPLKGRIFSKEHKRKLSKAKLNQSEETRQKIFESKMGSIPWNKGIKWEDMSGEKNPFYGKKHSAVSKKRMSKSLSGRKVPSICGSNHPMFKYPEKFKGCGRGKGGFRKDLGFYVRSRWEANMARIFNYLGLTFEYEPIHFPLSDGSTYTPDFYLYESDEFVEVKGFFHEEAKKKIKLFKREYPKVTFSMIFEKQYKEYLLNFNNCGLALE